MQPPAHFLAGAAVSRHVRWAPFGLALAFGSHFALDALPHFEDPSILPRGLATVAGENWGLILCGTHLAALALAMVTWLRLSGVWRGNRWRVVYVIAGGLLACLPDYVGRVWDPGGVIGYLNNEAHRWWFMPYIQAVRSQPDWRPRIAFACLAIELIVCGISGWLLLRGDGPVRAGRTDAESPDEATQEQERSAHSPGRR